MSGGRLVFLIGRNFQESLDWEKPSSEQCSCGNWVMKTSSPHCHHCCWFVELSEEQTRAKNFVAADIGFEGACTAQLAAGIPTAVVAAAGSDLAAAVVSTWHLHTSISHRLSTIALSRHSTHPADNNLNQHVFLSANTLSGQSTDLQHIRNKG